jgi:hypothetical protein
MEESDEMNKKFPSLPQTLKEGHVIGQKCHKKFPLILSRIINDRLVKTLIRFPLI